MLQGQLLAYDVLDAKTLEDACVVSYIKGSARGIYHQRDMPSPHASGDVVGFMMNRHTTIRADHACKGPLVVAPKPVISCTVCGKGGSGGNVGNAFQRFMQWLFAVFDGRLLGDQSQTHQQFPDGVR